MLSFSHYKVRRIKVCWASWCVMALAVKTLVSTSPCLSFYRCAKGPRCSRSHDCSYIQLCTQMLSFSHCTSCTKASLYMHPTPVLDLTVSSGYVFAISPPLWYATPSHVPHLAMSCSRSPLRSLEAPASSPQKRVTRRRSASAWIKWSGQYWPVNDSYLHTRLTWYFSSTTFFAWAFVLANWTQIQISRPCRLPWPSLTSRGLSPISARTEIHYITACIVPPPTAAFFSARQAVMEKRQPQKQEYAHHSEYKHYFPLLSLPFLYFLMVFLIWSLWWP